ncbi:GvpL/GvpF family gas vesicle protein [Methanothrix sp.]|uniref:GvpL/GvpF family gas vesicle protein n=1 Tax=Methanothrix sp. TaxID=90426 RepID=UPI002579D640|nr:GvpL/GvpF family gas vesicle protein [Methanothrix sp.]NPU88100.1 GvpL/GvpF family gas vesicle protein [Methanothrix sp.]
MERGDDLRDAIAEVVRSEVKAIGGELAPLISEIVRTELMPALRAAIRDAILRELSASYGGDEIVDIRECGPRRAFSEPEEIRRSAEPPVKEEAVAETVHADENGLYLYCLADASVSTSLGCVGIDGCEVYMIPHEGVSAVVHSCPLEPYRSDDEETVKRWVKSHQQVVDLAAERFGTVMPFGFDTIIAPKDSCTAEEVLKKWISDELEEIRRKMEKIRGRKEYGIQIFYDPAVFSERIENESDDVRRIKEEMTSKPPGVAYMYRQKLEAAVRRELDELMGAYFKEFYEKIRSNAEDIKVEKVRKSDGGMAMMMNLSVLASDESALGHVLDGIAAEPGITVRFTGPWQPYSFV